MEVIRILLADDHVLFRKGIATLISSRPDLEIVGEAADGLEAVNLARETKPDVILMDVSMPKLDGLAATKTIKEELPNIAVVVLTISDDENILFKAIDSGAKGYLLKNLEPEDLYQMLDRIRLGEAAISGAMATKILQELAGPSLSETKSQDKEEELTAREIEVLEEVVRGVYNKEIASNLKISENTVKIHLRNIMKKLRLHNRTAIAVHATRKGLVNDDTPSD